MGFTQNILNEHLRGKHSQESHGRRGGGVPQADETRERLAKSGGSLGALDKRITSLSHERAMYRIEEQRFKDLMPKTSLSTTGNITHQNLTMVNQSFVVLPQNLRDLVKEVRLEENLGPEFRIKETPYRYGASWDMQKGVMTLYDCKNRTSQEHYDGTIFHEVGHGFDRQWKDRSLLENKKANETREFDPFAKGTGLITPAGKLRPGKSLNDVPKGFEFYASRLLFETTFGIGSGQEDGITSYSKEWVGNEGYTGTETIAEMSKIYFKQAATIHRARLRDRRNLESPADRLYMETLDTAPTLSQAYLSALDNFIKLPNIDLSEDDILSEAKARKIVMTKYFDKKLEGVKEDKAYVAVRLTFDEERGTVLKSEWLFKTPNTSVLREARKPVDRIKRLSLIKEDKTLYEKYKLTNTKQMWALLKSFRIRQFESALEKFSEEAGCKVKAELTNNKILREFGVQSRKDARSIVNTFNYELVGRIAKLDEALTLQEKSDNIEAWITERQRRKWVQVSQWTSGKVKHKAAGEFFTRNGKHFEEGGFAELQGPYPAKEPICQGWFNRGAVPLREAISNPPPYHLGCPHFFKYTMPKFKGGVVCEDLWLG